MSSARRSECMKVRPSVKKDLRQVQGRPPQGRRPHHLREPAPQAAARLKRELETHGSYCRRRPPPSQAHRLRAAVPLRHRADARARDLREDRHPAEQEDRGAHRGRDQEDPRAPRGRLQGRGRSAPRSADEHQAPDGPRLLPRPPSPPGAAGQRAAHAHQRAHPQGPAQGHAARARAASPPERPERHRSSDMSQAKTSIPPRRRRRRSRRPSRPRRRSRRTSRPGSRTSSRPSTTRSSRSPT